MSAAVQQRILNYISHLSPFQLSELLDYLMFLGSKKAPRPSPDSIDAICGKYAHRLSSTKEFERNKKQEISRERKKWQAK